MNKTLLFMSTHFVDYAIISEYMKMQNTPNVDAILAIDNNAFKYAFTERIENKIFFGVSVKCFFFDSKLHDEMDLPYFAFKSDEKFGDVMWYNCDYVFYYVRKFFPDYDYYWRFEYDVFCNAKTYEGFLKKFSDNRADLLIKDFRDEVKDRDWQGTQKVNWIYNDQKINAGFFPVERLSARAIDFLYKRRLEHAKIFTEDNGKNKWIHCELFVATELMHNNFICGKLDEQHVQLINIYLNDDRVFLTPDDKLYHPVKSVKKEIVKMNAYVKDIVSMFGKLFFTTLINKLEDLNLKGWTHSMAPDFSYIIFPLATEGGGGQHQLHYGAQIMNKNIFISLNCQGKFADINADEFADIPDLQKFKSTGEVNRLVLSIKLVNQIDDVTKVAESMKNFIDITYPVIKKFLSE